VKCSISWIAFDYEYETGESGGEVLRLKRVLNPLAVFLDPASVETNGSDAKFVYVYDTMTRESFKELWPDAEAVSFDSDASEENRKEEEMITVVEKYEITEEEDRKRVTKKIMSGDAILEEEPFPGECLPYIPVYGNELWVKNKRILSSLIRKAKEPQQLYNLWKSVEIELLQKQPMAPVMVAAGQIEDYAEDWKNPTKTMALRYNGRDADGNLMPPPQRLNPPVTPTGASNAAFAARDDIKSTMGLYNSSIGQVGNETSGVAIQERKAQGDMATYHFGDNLYKAITQAGVGLSMAIPDIYTESRVLRIIGKEDEPRLVGVNGAIYGDQPVTVNLERAKYEVRVTTGVPFSSLRQEAAETMMQLFKAQPQFMQLFGDLLFKNMDFPGAVEIADRIKSTMPQNFFSKEKNPEVMQLMQKLQEQQEQMELMAAQLQSKQNEEMIEVESNKAKHQVEMSKIEIDRQKLELQKVESFIKAEESKHSGMIKEKELELKQKELELKAAESLNSEMLKRLEEIEKFLVIGNKAAIVPQMEE